MTEATAQSLEDTHNRTVFGTPTREKLQDPVVALYFAAAALEELATFGDEQRSLAFTIQAYVSGVLLVVAVLDQAYLPMCKPELQGIDNTCSL
jgi:hypothetical protein